MRAVKQSTARTILVFLAASADHVTGLAGATLTITSSKAGAAFASIAPTVVDRGSGWYSVALTAAMLDTLGDFALHITAASADPSDLLFEVVAYDPADATALGLSRLDAAVSSRSTYAGADTSGVTTLLSRVLGTLAAGTHNPQSGDAYARLGAPAGASIAADLVVIDGVADAVKAKTDNLPASPAAVGSQMTLAAGAITSAEAPALANLDAAVSTRLPTAGYTAPPSAAANATAVRSELATELGRVDTNVGSRLASAAYTAPDNAGIAAAEAAAEAVDARLPADPADESVLEAAIATRAAPGDAMALTTAAIDAILDEPVEGSVTLRQALRVLLAVIAGKASGAPTGPIVYRDIGDTKPRVTGAIDSSGNRTAVTLDVD